MSLQYLIKVGEHCRNSADCGLKHCGTGIADLQNLTSVIRQSLFLIFSSKEIHKNAGEDKNV